MSIEEVDEQIQQQQEQQKKIVSIKNQQKKDIMNESKSNIPLSHPTIRGMLFCYLKDIYLFFVPIYTYIHSNIFILLFLSYIFRWLVC